MAKTKLAKMNEKGFKIYKTIVLLKSEMCEACWERLASTAHHFYPQGGNGHIRYYIPNGIAICNECHFKHHTKGDPEVHINIIKRRGEKWLKDLKKEKNAKPPKYGTVKWVASEIERLENVLQEMDQ